MFIETAKPREIIDEETELTTQPLNTSEKSALISNQPVFSALEQSKQYEEETTTIMDDLSNLFNNTENVTENNNESHSSTLEPVIESEPTTGPSVSLEERVDGLLQNKSEAINLTSIS